MALTTTKSKLTTKLKICAYFMVPFLSNSTSLSARTNFALYNVLEAIGEATCRKDGQQTSRTNQFFITFTCKNGSKGGHFTVNHGSTQIGYGNFDKYKLDGILTFKENNYFEKMEISFNDGVISGKVITHIKQVINPQILDLEQGIASGTAIQNFYGDPVELKSGIRSESLPFLTNLAPLDSKPIASAITNFCDTRFQGVPSNVFSILPNLKCEIETGANRQWINLKSSGLYRADYECKSGQLSGDIKIFQTIGKYEVTGSALFFGSIENNTLTGSYQTFQRGLLIETGTLMDQNPLDSSLFLTRPEGFTQAT